MGWLIAVGILVALALLPLGVGGVYDHTGYILYFRIGPVRFALLPRKRKKQKAKKADNSTQNSANKKALPKKQDKSKGGILQDFFPLLHLILDFLGDARLKLRVNYLEAKVTLANDDPADLAITYGNAWTIVGNVMSQLERLFVIKKRDIEVQCDFTAEKTLIFARFDTTITIGRLVCLQVKYGIPVIREYLKIMNQRKGGAKI